MEWLLSSSFFDYVHEYDGHRLSKKKALCSDKSALCQDIGCIANHREVCQLLNCHPNLNTVFIPPGVSQVDCLGYTDKVTLSQYKVVTG